MRRRRPHSCLTGVLCQFQSANGALGWDGEMAWQTAHKLERVDVTYHLPDEALGLKASIQVRGSTSTKRGDLWTYHEVWEPDQTTPECMEPSDVIRHMLLVVEQDRPNTRARLDFGLTGGISWSEDELPFR